MLAIKCHCLQDTWVPILSKKVRGKGDFVFAHCVFCGKTITWMRGSEEKIRQDQDIDEISEDQILPEEKEWYLKKMNP